MSPSAARPTNATPQRSLENAINQFLIVTSRGSPYENSEAENLAQLRRLWSDLPEDAEHRARSCATCARSRWSSAS